MALACPKRSRPLRFAPRRARTGPAPERRWPVIGQVGHGPELGARARGVASALALGCLEREGDLLCGRVAGLVARDDRRCHTNLLALGEELAVLGGELEAD